MMEEDGFYTRVELESDPAGMTNRVLEDLRSDTPHPEDAAIKAEWQRKTDQGKEVRKLLDDNNINYKGMTDQEVMQTYDDIVNDRLPPVRDEVPLAESDMLSLNTVDNSSTVRLFFLRVSTNLSINLGLEFANNTASFNWSDILTFGFLGISSSSIICIPTSITLWFKPVVVSV